MFLSLMVGGAARFQVGEHFRQQRTRVLLCYRLLMVDYPTPAEPEPKHIQRKDAKKKRLQLRTQEPQRVLPP